jgi:hypothetical protein
MSLVLPALIVWAAVLCSGGTMEAD